MMQCFILWNGHRREYLARRNPHRVLEYTIYAYDAAPIQKMATAEAVAQKIAKPGERWEIHRLDKVKMTEEVVKAWQQ